MRTLLALAVFLATCSAMAQEPLVFEDPALERRFNDLTEELRCLVCQNQNLADSDAPLAHDLKKEIHAMLIAGQGDEQIKQFLVERYGDFVLYRPPFGGNTLVLWLAPALLLGGGAVAVVMIIRKRQRLFEQSRSERKT